MRIVRRLGPANRHGHHCLAVPVAIAGEARAAWRDVLGFSRYTRGGRHVAIIHSSLVGVFTAILLGSTGASNLTCVLFVLHEIRSV